MKHRARQCRVVSLDWGLKPDVVEELALVLLAQEQWTTAFAHLSFYFLGYVRLSCIKAFSMAPAPVTTMSTDDGQVPSPPLTPAHSVPGDPVSPQLRVQERMLTEQIRPSVTPANLTSVHTG